MSRRKTPTMPTDAAAYLADTRHLSPLEHGAYWLLMLHYWQSGSLPTDECAIKRITGLSQEEWTASRDTLYALFKLGGWKHKRIEFELTEANRTVAAASKAGKASAAKRAEKAKHKQEAATTVGKPLQRNGNDPSTPKKVSKEERALDPRGSNGADAPPTAPVYTDSRHELWGEGIAILGQLGVAEKTARPIIGRWLKDAKDDTQAVLGAIQRARDNRVIDPVPWITRAISNGAGNGTHRQFGQGGAGKGKGFSAYALELARNADIDR